jgi:hypothetical protein
MTVTHKTATKNTLSGINDRTFKRTPLPHHGTIDSSISTYLLSLNVRMYNFFSSLFCSPVFYKISITVSTSSANKAHLTSLALAICLEI